MPAILWKSQHLLNRWVPTYEEAAPLLEKEGATNFCVKENPVTVQVDFYNNEGHLIATLVFARENYKGQPPQTTQPAKQL